MLTFSRSMEQVEIGLGEKRLTVALDRLQSTALAAERRSDGRLVNALLMTFFGAQAPARIEGPTAALGEIHRYLSEAMQEMPALAIGHGTFAGGSHAADSIYA